MNKKEKINELLYDAWKSAANAHRLYPESKHTYSDYYANYGQPKLNALVTELDKETEEGIFDYYDGGKVNVHPQHINGFNKGYASCEKDYVPVFRHPLLYSSARC